jgi:hypothetical protein
MSENALLDSVSNEAIEKQPKAEPGTGTVIRRKRGGQPGNQNALRHGFYAANLGQISPRQYDENEMRNLLGQAAMLKDYMYKLYTTNAESTDSDTIIESLRALALAGISIARVLQAHNDLRIYGSKTDGTFDQLFSSLDAASDQAASLDLS